MTTDLVAYNVTQLLPYSSGGETSKWVSLGLDQGVRQGGVPSGGSRGQPVPLLLEAAHIPGLMAPSIFKASNCISPTSDSVITSLSLTLCLSLSLIKTLVIALGPPPG